MNLPSPRPAGGSQTTHRPKRLPTALPRRRQRWWAWLAAAPVTACLTAACASAASTGSTPASAVTSASAATAPLDCAPPGVKRPPCYSPRAYQAAYGVAPLLRRGINGSGEGVVLPELASSRPSTDIRKDLATFDSKFGLPPARLHVVNTIARSTTPYLADDEEVEDTEVVHAIAPAATLDVVLVPQDAVSGSAGFTAAAARVIQAGVALRAAVISVSASYGEHFFTRAEVAAMHAALEPRAARTGLSAVRAPPARATAGR